MENVKTPSVKQLTRREFLRTSILAAGAFVLTNCAPQPTPVPPATATAVKPTVAPTTVPPTTVPPAVAPTVDPWLQEDKARLNAVIEFANNVLKNGRDKYRASPTALFADGIDTFTSDQVRWRTPGTKGEVDSDLAIQQNLCRTFTALSNLTGDAKYKDAVKAAIKYNFGVADSSGLMQWGGHRYINLETLELGGPGGKGFVHELKNCFPFYELMYEVNPDATTQFVKAFWNAHILDWDEMYVSRHGQYGLKVGDVWGHKMVTLPSMRESSGLSFINAGNDLIYAAGTLYRLVKDKGALDWAKHLANQYILARHPKTGLGVYQFTQPRKTADTKDDTDTNSKYGDRAKRQFGPEFGAIALEGYLLLSGQAGSIYGENALMQFQLANEVGKDASDLLEATRKGLVAFANYAYLPDKNMCKPMFVDGTDLTDYALKRDGYYGKSGTVLKLYPADRFLISYARGFLYTGDETLWKMARNIGKGIGLGDLGSAPGKDVSVNLKTESMDARALFAVLDLYKATSNPEYLKLARALGNNIVKSNFNRGFFTAGPKFIYAQFDAVEPLALLALQAAIENKLDKAPSFIDGNGFLDGDYEMLDGSIKGVTDSYIYSQQK